MQQGTASGGGGLMAAARASGRAAAKSGRGGGKASWKAGGDSEPRTIVTGMEGLEHLFKEATVYPDYSAGGVQPMHSGGWGGVQSGSARWVWCHTVRMPAARHCLQQVPALQ